MSQIGVVAFVLGAGCFSGVLEEELGVMVACGMDGK